MLAEGGCCCHPFTGTATGVRTISNDRYHLHTHALSVGGAAKGFELKLDELSCKGQDRACGTEEMSSDIMGVEGTKHPPTHILT